MFLHILKTYSFLAAFAPVFVGAVIVEIVCYKFPLVLKAPGFCDKGLSRWEELHRKIPSRLILSVIFTFFLFYFFASQIPLPYYAVFFITVYFSTPDFLRVRYWFLKNGWRDFEDGFFMRFFGLVIIILVLGTIAGKIGYRVITLLPFIFMFGTATARHFTYRE